MIAFLDNAGKTYWKEVTEWENNRCKWKAAIVIELAKHRRGIVWQHTRTNEPPTTLATKTPDKVLQMALKGQLDDQWKIFQTLLATHKEQDKTLALHGKQKNRERNNKGKRKANSSLSQTPSKQPVTTTRSSSKLAGPPPPNKATTTANQNPELANIASPTTVPAMLSASQKTLAAILQALRPTAPTLAMSTTIKTRAATLHTAKNAQATEDTVLGNVNQDKPSVLLVTKRTQTIGSSLSQRPTTTITSATHRPTTKQEPVAKRQMPPIPKNQMATF